MNDLNPTTPDPAGLPLFQNSAPQAAPDARARQHLLAAVQGGSPWAPPAQTTAPVEPAPTIEHIVPPVPPTAPPIASMTRPRPVEVHSIDELLDWDIVERLQRDASEKLPDTDANGREGSLYLDTATASAALSTEDLARQEIIAKVVEDHVTLQVLQKHGAEFGWSNQKKQRYVTSVFNEIYRWGRIQPLLTEVGAKHINIIGHDNVIIRYQDGSYKKQPPIARNNVELMQVMQNLAKKRGRAFSDIKASVGFDLDGARLNVLASSVAGVPAVGIRIHNHVDVDLDDMIKLQTINERGASLLRAAVLSRRNVLFSGEPGSGKTTILRAVSAAVPYDELIATIETERELYLHKLTHRHIGVIPIQMREGTSEGAGGGYPLRQGIKDALRQNLMRVFLGEARGDEVKALMEAMQIGGGSFATIHAESPADTIFRLANLIIEEGNLTNDYYPLRLIQQHIHLIVQMKEIKDRDGRPRHIVTEIAEVMPETSPGKGPLPQALLRFDRDADELVFGANQPSTGLRAKLEEHGLSQTFFRREAA